MESKVRVRFAPSPTGFLHIGGLRTALFNFLFARSKGGSIVLRIEDTDQNRKVENAEAALIEILHWAGIDFDEGPQIGGDFGPYIQSKRLSIYQEHIDYLLKEEHAYRCFCSVERLDKIRAEQQKRKLNPRYDGFCRALSAEQISQNLAAKMPFVVRLKIKQSRNDYIFEDLIRGQVKISSKQIDDQVLQKSDGYPTYHLANVVDDHHMQITHVIRGEEWLSSVPKHIQLYEYLGWKPPLWAHIPLLLNSDKSKLSKRQNDVSVESYRAKGYSRAALLNFICLLGWSPKTNQEIFSADELLQNFDLAGINKSGAIVNTEKLDWFSTQHFALMPDLELDSHAQQYYPPFFKALEANDRYSGLNLIKPAITCLSALPELLSQLDIASIDASNELSKIDEAKLILAELKQSLLKIENIDSSTIKNIISEIIKANKLKPGIVYQTIRLCLTGHSHGIDLSSLIVFHGIEKVLKQIDKYK